MPIVVNKIRDLEIVEQVFSVLIRAGFQAERKDDVVTVSQAGVGTGDSSVNVRIQNMSLNDVHVVRIRSEITTHPAPFDKAQVAMYQGNADSVLAKFIIKEDMSMSSSERFRLFGQFTISAEWLSDDEFIRMFTLFIGELDELDNRLREILTGSDSESRTIILP